MESTPGARGTVQVYPYDENDPCGPSRDHKHTLLHAQEAISTGKPVRYLHTLVIFFYAYMYLIKGATLM